MIKEKGEKGKNHIKNRIFLIINFIFFLFLEKLRFFITFFPFSPFSPLPPSLCIMLQIYYHIYSGAYTLRYILYMNIAIVTAKGIAQNDIAQRAYRIYSEAYRIYLILYNLDII